MLSVEVLGCFLGEVRVAGKEKDLPFLRHVGQQVERRVEVHVGQVEEANHSDVWGWRNTFLLLSVADAGGFFHPFLPFLSLRSPPSSELRDEHKQENDARKDPEGNENLTLHTAIHGE